MAMCFQIKEIQFKVYPLIQPSSIKAILNYIYQKLAVLLKIMSKTQNQTTQNQTHAIKAVNIHEAKKLEIPALKHNQHHNHLMKQAPF